jgi:glycosyltransferase involved in cell wall biosynthesis
VIRDPKLAAPQREAMFLIPSLAGGGAERVVSNLVRYIDRTAYKPTLVLVVKGDDALRARIPADVEVIELGFERLRWALVAIIRLIWERRPSVILSTLDHLNVTLGLLRWAMPRSSKLILRLTDLGSLDKRGLRRMLGLSIPRSDGWIFQSDEMGAVFSKALGLPPRRGAVIHNPVDVDEIRRSAAADLDTGFAPSTLNLVAAGRLAPAKGFDLLLGALALLNRPDVHLAILGAGAEEGALKALAVTLGLEDRVRFLGFQPNPYPYFARADAFVLSSRSEGFPNVVLEALVCGARVVSTPVPGVAGLLKGQADCVIAADMSSEAIAAALAKALETPKSTGREDLLNQFRAANIVRLYQDYFDRVIAGRL